MFWTISVILVVFWVLTIWALVFGVKARGGLRRAYAEVVESMAVPRQFSLAAGVGLATLALLVLLVEFGCASR